MTPARKLNPRIIFLEILDVVGELLEDGRKAIHVGDVTRAEGKKLEGTDA